MQDSENKREIKEMHGTKQKKVLAFNINLNY